VEEEMETAPATQELALGHLIDGCWYEPLGDEWVEIVNPATEEVLATVPRATEREAELAIMAARRAFDEGTWTRLARRERGRMLRQLADALAAAQDRLIDLVVAQGGCTVTQARGMQVGEPIEALYRYADLAERDPVEVFDLALSSSQADVPGIGHTVVVREPVGVVAAITAFNYPFFLNVHKIGAALAAGCTVVLKPTEYTCLDAAELSRLVIEATDLPPGVLNVLLGGHGDVGSLLCADPRVDLVSFTGSTATGRRVMAAASETIKRVALELGGKSANVIFADADLDVALAGDCALVIRHCGQGCAALSRVIVEDSIHDEVVDRMLARARSVVVGDPTDPATEMGPLVSRRQLDRVTRYISTGVAEGATLASGGRRPPGLDRGYFVEPTIFTDAAPGMTIAREEIFGPVVVVQRFTSEDEAVRIANDSIYGLVGAVWSGTLERGLRVARAIRTGTVSVNGPGSGLLDPPYGGYKQSGVGREFGLAGYLEYTQSKTLKYMAR
jgi:aldehyde dehydrogenase (NAD+)